MDLDLREGSREGFEAQVDFGMAGAGAVVEGPLGGGGSWLASARHSWTDLLVDIAEIDAVPSYSDFCARLVYDSSPLDRFAFTGIGALDYVDYTRGSATGDGNPDYGITRSHNLMTGMSWRRLWEEGGYSLTSLSFQEVMYGGEYRRTSTGGLQVLQDSRERAVAFRHGMTWRTGEHAGLDLGVDGRLEADDFDNWFAADTNFSGDPLPPLDVDEKVLAAGCGLYGTLTIPVAPLVEAGLGGRIDYYDRQGAFVFSPRLSVRYEPSEASAFYASTGLYGQPLPAELLSRSDACEDLAVPRAVHATAGYSRLLRDDTRLVAEVYGKEYSDLPYDPAQPGYSILDGLGSEQDLYSFEALVDGGRARAFGVELMVEKKLAGGIYGLLAGSCSRTMYRNPGENWRDRIFDNRWTFTAEGGYRPGGDWELSMRWVYAGGRPFTPLDPEASAEFGRSVYDSTRINGERLPAFHSLNIRADRRFFFSSSTLVAYASLWNVYDRRNVSSVFWNEIEQRPDEILQWGIMPVLGLEYEF
jgi:hypothetical protein